MILQNAQAFNRPQYSFPRRLTELDKNWPKLASVLLALAISSPSAAQDLTDTTRTYSVDEVTVIESRSGLDPARLPYSATVLPVGVGIASRADALAGVLATVPGVFAASRSGGTDLRLTIRGFGARGNGDRSNSGTIRGVKVLLDGIPLTEPDGRTSTDLLTFLQGGRVEVLRTNASSLFGNASGGIVNVESWEPGEASSWSLTASAGSFGVRKLIGRAGMPYESGSLTISGGAMSMDGWRQNSAVEAAGVYAVAVARPSDGLRIRASLGLTRNRFGIPGALTDEEFAADPSAADPVYASRRERRDNLVGLSSLQISQAIGGEHSVSISAYLGPKSLTRSERNTFREFERWAGGGGVVWRWIPSVGLTIATGVDGSLQDGGSLFYTLVNGDRGDSLRTNKAERAATLGWFVEGSMSVGAFWGISAGIRFDRQRYRSTVFPAGTTLRYRQEALTFDHATPHAGLSYRIDEGQSVFLSLSGGLEVPAFNEVDPPPGIGAADLNPLLRPMTSTTIEIGHRSRMMVGDDWTLVTSAALYHIAVRDEIVPFDNGAWFISAGRSERIGMEAAGTVTTPDGGELMISWTMLRGRYLSFVSSAGTFSGNRIPGIPASMLVARFLCPVVDRWSIEVAGRMVGPTTVDDANTLQIPASTLADAAITWSRVLFGAPVQIRFDVRNLLNATTTVSAFINPSSRPQRASLGGAVAPAYREPGLPRHVALTVSIGS